MKSKCYKTISRFFILIFVLTAMLPWLPSNVIAVHANTAASVDYVKDGDKRVGIRRIVQSTKGYDETYYDLNDGVKGESGFAMDSNENQVDFYKQVLTSGTSDYQATILDSPGSILNQWASMAEAIFQSNATYSSYINCSGGFANNFANGKRTTDAGYTDVSQALARTTSYTKGSREKDNTYISGLCTAKNLSEVRQRAAQQTADRLNRKLKANDFLNATNEGGVDTLSQLKDDTGRTCIYNLVTCFDRQGATACYCYNTFGIVFYDFTVSPITAKGVQAVTAAEGEKSIKDAAQKLVPGVTYETTDDQNQRINYYENDTKQSATVQMSSTNSRTESVSTTISKTNTYTFTEKVAEALKISEFFGFADLESTTTFEFTASQAISTAWSETKSIQKTATDTITDSVVLPAHTAVAMQSSEGKTNIALNFDCPVAINYKVAIFSMNGKCYDDDLAVQAFKTAGYRQSYFCTMFGTPNSTKGETAIESLYNRAISHRSDMGYEKSYGNTYGYTHHRAHDPSSIDYINWDDVLKNIEPDPHIFSDEKKPLTVRYMETKNGVPTGKVLYEKTVEDQYPVALETRFTINGTLEIDGKQYKAISGRIKDSSGNELDTYTYSGGSNTYYQYYQPIDTDTFEYLYALKDEDGQIKRDADGNAIYASPEYKAQKEAEEYSLNFYFKDINETVGTSEEEETEENVTNDDFPPDIVKTVEELGKTVSWLSCHIPMSATGATNHINAEGKNSKLYGIVPLYPLNAVYIDQDYYNSSYQYTGKTTDYKVLNLLSGDTFSTSNIVLSGKNRAGVNFYGFVQAKGHWEITDVNGVPLKDSKIASLSTDDSSKSQTLVAGDEGGTVYMKYFINEDCYKAKGEESYTKNSDLEYSVMVKVNVSNKPFDGSVELSGSPTAYVGETMDLKVADGVSAYVFDATGKKISGAPIKWESQLDEDDGISIDEDTGNVEFAKEGSFKVRIKYQDTYSDWMTILVKAARKLDKITISDDDNLLESYIYDGEKEISLSKIKETAKAYNQYDEKTTMDNPEWIVTDKDGKATDKVSLDGDKMTVKGDGTFQITLKDGDVTSNKLTLIVQQERYLKEVSISSDSLKDIGIGQAYKYDLDEITVAAKDQYGDDYDFTKVAYRWNVGGRYSTVETGTKSYIVGLVTGEDKLSLTIYSGAENEITSNELSYNIKAMPYVSELYSYEGDYISEGDIFSLNDVKFVAKDENYNNYNLSKAEIDSLEWTLTDKGSIPSGNVTMDPSAKTLTVKEGTLAYGSTGTVILTAKFSNINGKTATAKRVLVKVKQKPLLAQLILSKKEENAQIAADSNVALGDFFKVIGQDQYGEGYDLSDTTLNYASSNENAYVIENASNIIVGKTPGQSSDITVSAKGKADNSIVSSNKITLQVPKKKELVSIKIQDAPSIMEFNKEVDLLTFNTACFDENGAKLTEQDLKTMSAEIKYNIEKGNTNVTFDEKSNKIKTGTAYGNIVVTAYVVNKETQQPLVDHKDQEITAKAKIWIGYGKSISLTPSSANMLVGQSQQMVAAIYPADIAGEYTWQSSDANVVNVDQTGKITAISVGSATITVSCKGISATSTIIVGSPVGTEFNNGIYHYVIKNADPNGNGTVSCTGFAPGKNTANVNIPSTATSNGIVYKVTAIAEKAFNYDKRIKKVTIGDNVTEIGRFAFYSCPKLKSLIIGKNVVKIGRHAFCKDKALKLITMKGWVLKTIEGPHTFIQVKNCKVILQKKNGEAIKKLFKKTGMKKIKFK